MTFRIPLFFILAALISHALPGKPPREIWERYQVAFIGQGGDDTTFAATRQGARDAAKVLEHQHNLEITILDLTPKPGAQNAQGEALKEAFVQGADAILIDVRDPKAIEKELELMVKQRIPLIFINHEAPGTPHVSIVQSDQIALGRVAMEQLALSLPRGGKVAILAGPEEDARMKERLIGAREAAGKQPKINVYQVVHCAADFQAAVDALSRTVADDRDQHIDAWLLLGNWPLMGAATLPWDPQRTPSIGIDALPPMMPYIAQEQINGLVAQMYYKWGELAMEAAISQVHLKQAPEPRYETGSELITQENLPEYSRGWAQWMQ